jgi:hypothetical protein
MTASRGKNTLDGADPQTKRNRKERAFLELSDFLSFIPRMVSRDYLHRKMFSCVPLLEKAWNSNGVCQSSSAMLLRWRWAQNSPWFGTFATSRQIVITDSTTVELRREGRFRRKNLSLSESSTIITTFQSLERCWSIQLFDYVIHDRIPTPAKHPPI